MTTQKVKSFMDSPLVAWIRTFDDFSTLRSVSDLADAVVLHRVMNAVDPIQFSLSAVNKSVAGNFQARLENLVLLVTRITDFYQTSLQHLVVASLPNITLIAQDPEKHQSLDELEKLMVLLLGCVVQCDSKGPLIEKMKGMQVGHQHALVSHIQQVTDTTDYVCSYDWTSFEEMSKENVEALCQAAFRHLHNISKERDQMYKSVSELTMERDYLQNAHENGMSGGDVSPIIAKHLAGPYSPSPQVNQEVLELRGKVRNLQEQLDQRMDALVDAREQLEQSRIMVHGLQQEKRELFEELHSHKLFRDEMETLQVQAAKCERLEAEVQRYRQKAEDLEYVKKRVEDFKHQNDLMMETKALLEEKASSLSTRAEAYDDLQAEVASLKVQIDALNQEKEIDLRRIEELISQSARLELGNKTLDEKVRSLQVELEEERERVVSDGYGSGGGGGGGGESSLSLEMSEADMSAKVKLVRLEKEAADYERVREELRTASAKVAELDKANKKLYAQAHADKKTIIKLNEEVESLRVKGSRVEKLQAELSSQKERFEEVDLLRSKLKEMKLRHEQTLEGKAKIEDEVEMLRSKVTLLEDIQADHAQLKAQCDALTSQVEEEKNRTGELLAQNAQLEVEKQTWSEETAAMATELEQLRSRQPTALPTVISPPRISESEMAARAKLQRLERENHQLEKTVATLRHAQAKAEELEKANKKLHGGAHDSRREIIKLKGELQEAKSRVSRLESAQKEMKHLMQQSEDTELANKQIRELKQQINLILESKAMLEDERNDLLSKLQHVASWEEERASLQGKIEALEVEQEDSSRRVQELLESNTQLEIERDRKEREVHDVKMELEDLRKRPPKPTTDEATTVSKGKLVVTEDSPTPQPTEKELALTAEAQKLSREKRELENALSTLKKNSAAAQEELSKASRKLTAEMQSVKRENIRLREELSREKGQKTQLTNDLVKVKEDYRKSLIFLETGDWEDRVKEDKTRETKRIEEIEARIDEAYKKTLAAKEERIAGLEKRLMEASSANDSLQMEVSLMKKQSKVQRLNSSPMSSPGGSPYTSRQEKTKSLIDSPLLAVATVGPSELARLKEKALEYNRLKEQMEALKDDNQNLVAELMDARQVVQEMEASNIRLQDRSSMQDQLFRTMEEENKTLLQQVNKLLEQNHSLLMKTLESKDQHLEEGKVFQNRVGELEAQRAELHSQLESQRKEAVLRELELYKRQHKKPSILKRGIQKLKGRMSQRQSGSQSVVAIDGFSRSRSNTYNLGSSYASSITGLPRQDSNASSDEQSLSPSTGASEGDLHDPQLLFVPTMNSSPRTPMKATTLPRSSPGDASFRLGEASSQKGGDVMTLEDFLAESDKTPKSKRKYIELSKAVSTYTSPRASGDVSVQSRGSLEPRSEQIDIPEFLKTGSSPRGSHLVSIPPDEGNSQASQQSHTSSRRDSDYSITSSHSYHSSSRSSGINQAGSLNQNYHNSTSERGTFNLQPVTVTYRGRSHTIDSVEGQRGGESLVISKKPPRPTVVARIPVRGCQSTTSLSKSKSSDELCDITGPAGKPLGHSQLSRRALKRASSGDLLSSDGTHKPRRYSEVPGGFRRWASSELLDEKTNGGRATSLAVLTNVQTAEKQRIVEKGMDSCTVQLDLNNSVGPNDTAWYDYGAV